MTIWRVRTPFSEMHICNPNSKCCPSFPGPVTGEALFWERLKLRGLVSQSMRLPRKQKLKHCGTAELSQNFINTVQCGNTMVETCGNPAKLE